MASSNSQEVRRPGDFRAGRHRRGRISLVRF